MKETIELDIRDRVARIRLNRPQSLNSINEAMHRELKEAVAEVKHSPARVLLLTGAGKGFCSGQDLSDRHDSQVDPQVNHGSGAAPDLGESLDKRYNPLIRELAQLPIPIVAAVNGVAAGAGVSLALIADLVIMAESASLVLAFSKIGLVPDSGCSWLLSHSIGWRRAKAVSLLGERITSRQALDWGIAWQVFPDGELEAGATGLAARLRDLPTRGLAYIKRVYAQALNNDLFQQLETERDFQRLAGRTEDYREGVAAFLEKRRPEFKGK